MNGIEQHIICKHQGKVIAYLLAMTARSKNEIPVLRPMFETFETLYFRGNLISLYKYMVVGQVCVDKNYRGKGILDQCYKTYKEVLKKSYNFAITEIACQNLRSVNAHKRIGFEEIFQYTSPDGMEWSIVILNW